MTALDAADIPPLRLGDSASVAITSHLERLIAKGAIAPGTKLPNERELAESLSVSRSTLREAMHELESKHLVERVRGRGTIVLGPPPEVWDLRAMTADTSTGYVAELRYALEPDIARLAAIRSTPADIRSLRQSLDRADADLRPAHSMDLDIEFHLLVAHASQNPLMATLASLASEWTRDERAFTHSTRAWRRLSIDGHASILEAIEQHDAQGARDAMHDHLLDVRRRIAASVVRPKSAEATPGE